MEVRHRAWLEDPGFDHSVLREFRARPAGQDGAADRLLQVLLVRLREAALLKAGGRQRTDATHVLAAVRTLRRLKLVGETLRAIGGRRSGSLRRARSVSSSCARPRDRLRVLRSVPALAVFRLGVGKIKIEVRSSPRCTRRRPGPARTAVSEVTLPLRHHDRIVSGQLAPSDTS
jgi:hypothetical protein